jgi:hypothetical protein
MNISEIFIRRPVMTTLVSAAIILFGIIAFRFLPVSDLPNVDFPTIHGDGQSARREVRRRWRRRWRRLSRTSVLDHRRALDSMNSTSIAELRPQITLQFALERQYGRRRSGRAGGDRGCPAPVAPGHAEPAAFQQGKPRGYADPVPGAEFTRRCRFRPLHELRETR